ncbi:helix-turn-helix transcriptional regulator [Mesorhizobium sp. M0047]|uniref:helix-turn-helix domain-containing protein n=2 Tax=Mesorhizobium TaxID=68287 RepID=UPI003338EB1D
MFQFLFEPEQLGVWAFEVRMIDHVHRIFLLSRKPAASVSPDNSALREVTAAMEAAPIPARMVRRENLPMAAGIASRAAGTVFGIWNSPSVVILTLVKIAQERRVVKPAQVRMARAALNWSLADLSKAAGVHRNTISNFETGKYGGSEDALAAIERALESAGIEFIAENGGGAGVRLQKP